MDPLQSSNFFDFIDSTLTAIFLNFWFRFCELLAGFWEYVPSSHFDLPRALERKCGQAERQSGFAEEVSEVADRKVQVAIFLSVMVRDRVFYGCVEKYSNAVVQDVKEVYDGRVDKLVEEDYFGIEVELVAV